MAEPNQDQPFRVFNTQEEFDNAAASIKKKAEEKYAKEYRSQLETEIRQQISDEAKLDGQQKLEAERKKFNEEMKNQKIELNKDIAKSMLSKNGFDESEMDTYLSFVTDDKESSIANITKVCEDRKKFQERLHSKWTEELKGNQPKIEHGNTQSKDGDLQAQYDNAKKSGDTVRMSAIIRTANAEGITLN